MTMVITPCSPLHKKAAGQVEHPAQIWIGTTLAGGSIFGRRQQGDVPIDNNFVENRIRPWALGRRNWLLIGSQLAGERAAVVMSLLQSARLNEHEPWAYLKDVLKRLPMQLKAASRSCCLTGGNPQAEFDQIDIRRRTEIAAACVVTDATSATTLSQRATNAVVFDHTAELMFDTVAR